MELTQEQTNQILRLKSYFPYRIVFGVLYNDGNFETYAETTKRKMNAFLKNPNCTVFAIQK